jgi:diamine N-acetyltransferase
MIRNAKICDINKILDLLKQVNLIHVSARPDIFKVVTKYSYDELCKKIKEEPIFVYVDENNNVLGYIFGVVQETKSEHLINKKTFFIDDFCVDQNARGLHIGSELYEYVREYARKENFDRITLNVWSFNENAYKFYLKCGLKPLETVMEEVIKK